MLPRGLRSLDYSALLALIGTITAALLSASFLSDLILNPSVYVEIFNNGTRTPELLITNDGSKPANNLHVYILTSPPNKIVNITNTFSTTGVNLVGSTKLLEKDKPVTVNSDTVEIFIPKLVQGPGSEAYIRNLLESESGSFKVITSYDEGSGVGSTQPSIVRSITSTFAAPTTSTSTLLLIIIIGFVSLIPLTILAFKLRRRIKRRIIKTLLSNIQENRRKILKENSTSEEFINLYRKESDSSLEEKERQKQWNSRHSAELSKLIKNPKDYAVIDDLYTKISQRNEKINSLPTYDKKEVNTECFNLMEKALNIEWDNYL
jgi:hypothetical protein